MTCFISAKSFSKTLVKGYRFRSFYKLHPMEFHFRKEIYDWCSKNGIHYRRIGYPEYGFIFENEADIMAIKLRWL